jgi:hypothetical protein
MRYLSRSVACALAGVVAGCAQPASPNNDSPKPSDLSLSASLTPNRHLEIILRGDGFGLVQFRQPKDDAPTVFLDTWVRDLDPNTSYQLQRAVDQTIDDVCTGGTTNPAEWLTLGEGLTPRAITTDETGTGRAPLFRILSLTSIGQAFDIHFRVIDATTQAVVLESGCYQFEASL